MKELNEIQSSALFDIRVEAVAATLLSQDETLIMEQIVVAPVGHARRRSNHEITEIEKRYFLHDNYEETVWQIGVSRKGFYDTLPEHLFLRLEEDYPTPSAKAKAIERQISEARKFFLPFEQALYLPRIETEQLEQKWTEGFPEFIKNIWGLRIFGDCLDTRQRFLLCYLLPEAHRIAGDWTLTKLCFEAILKKQVDLRFVAPIEYNIPESDELPGEIELGDLILGDAFRDDIPALEVYIDGITLEELPGYLPGGKMRRVLEELLYSYFLPLDVTVITSINVTEEAWGFTFGEAVLGYNVRLN